ncbi:MAG: D-tyrosyl-tRNA(Tyr) deacylase [Clostridiales bacterium]|nr:D-tyrosyl-tRNA(Tyr) deacylase [Clostridiales bacterium]
MRAVIQRVAQAKVDIDGKTVGEIDRGLLILLGVMENDTEKDAQFLADKIVNLRIFSDSAGKMNLSLCDVCGGALVVSQFTLAADCRHGRRPSFTQSAPAQEADMLYEYFKTEMAQGGISNIQSGVFGADMQVFLVNDGPVTIILDSAELLRRTDKTGRN